MKKINQNDKNLGNMAEELQKLCKEIAPLQKKKKAGPAVIPSGLSVSNDSVYNDSLKFIFIFTF